VATTALAAIYNLLYQKHVLDRFASPLAVRPKEASDGFHTIGDVMPLTASAHVVACATTHVQTQVLK